MCIHRAQLTLIYELCNKIHQYIRTTISPAVLCKKDGIWEIIDVSEDGLFYCNQF